MEFKFRGLEYKDLCWFKDVRSTAYHQLYNDQDFSLEEYQEWYNTKHGEGNEELFFVININDTDIGYFRTSEHDGVNHSFKIGGDIHSDHRGKGYAVPAYEAFFKYMKDMITSIPHYTVYLDVLESNERAVHIYKKLGFKTFDTKEHKGKKVLKMKKSL
jgi:diamine N-acetyltransferase